MSRRGICPVCNRDKYLGHRRVCKPCIYQVGECANCSNLGKIYIDGLCYCCYQHRQVLKKLIDIEKSFQAISDYNGNLFGLYLTYIKRYRLQYYHLRQTEQLRTILERDSWPTVKSWQDIYHLSRRYRLFHKNGKKNGCAVKKIGFMLEELRILSAKDRDLAYSIAALFTRTDDSLIENMTDYVKWMQDSGRTESTILTNMRIILNFHKWLKTVYPQIDFNLVNESKAVEHLEYLKVAGISPSCIRRTLHAIRRFFEWLQYRKQILSNPLKNLEAPRQQVKIHILADDDLAGLIKYIKKGDSDPESALCLTLMLYWGFTTDDLLHAVIENSNTILSIILNSRRPSKGRSCYNRDQKLTLPTHPGWLKDLSLRFQQQWSERYKNTITTYPVKPLLLTENGVHARGITDTTLLERIHLATKTATGKAISPKILRQACGHLYSRNGDGSILSTLGWSSQFAFHYTWLPREIFTGASSGKNPQ